MYFFIFLIYFAANFCFFFFFFGVPCSPRSLFLILAFSSPHFLRFSLRATQLRICLLTHSSRRPSSSTQRQLVEAEDKGPGLMVSLISCNDTNGLKSKTPYSPQNALRFET